MIATDLTYLICCVYKDRESCLKNDRFKNDNLKKTDFKKRLFLKTIVSFSIFRRRFHNETIVFQQNENVNIPTVALLKNRSGEPVFK